jgi:hypothetical protein
LSELHLPDGAVYKTGETVEAAPEQWDGNVEGMLIKSVDERRYTLTMGYPADTPDAAVARDGHLDFASEAEVEKAAWGFLASTPEVGLWHQDGTEGAGRIVESYVYRGPDWPIEAADGSTQVIKAGDWLIGTVWNDDAWNLIKSGEIGGTSMQGSANRRTPSPADVARVVNGKRR